MPLTLGRHIYYSQNVSSCDSASWGMLWLAEHSAKAFTSKGGIRSHHSYSMADGSMWKYL